MVYEYSLAKDGEQRLLDNFRVKEFACKDGSDKILIDAALVVCLQEIRDHFGKPVNISSAYRTEGYNKRINGAKNSQHLYGKAADIRVSGVEPTQVALYAQSKGYHGIGLYSYETIGSTMESGFVHIDTRDGYWRGLQISKNGNSQSLDKYFPTLTYGSHGNAVALLQRKLGINDDGGYGIDTFCAVARLQAAKGLDVDGKCGDRTWAALYDIK